MARTNTVIPRPDSHSRSKRAPLISTMLVARWQVRQSWRFLLIVGVGFVIAVILACSIPLYSLIAVSAGIRDALNSIPGGPYVTVHSESQQISIPHIGGVAQQLKQDFQNRLGGFVDTTPTFSLQMPNMPIVQPYVERAVMNLTGADIRQARQHVKILQGRLPSPRSSELEVAVLPEIAAFLKVHVDSLVIVQAFSGHPPPGQSAKLNLILHIVGIFTPSSQMDQYWHGEDFQRVSPPANGSAPAIYKALVSNDTLLTLLNGINTRPAQFDPNTGQYIGGGVLAFLAAPDLYWYYRLEATHVDANNLDTMINGLAKVINDTTGNPVDALYVKNTLSLGPISALISYRDYLSVIRIPATSLWLLLMGVVLYFVSVMTDILVDRKAETIPVLRSRGASRRQVFSAFVAQSAGLGLIAVVIGPLVAVVVVRIFVLQTLSATDQSSLNILTFEPVQIAIGLLESALAAALVAMVAMMIAICRAARMDILAVRRESARSTRIALWQRYRLDVVAGIVALVGYGFSIYLTSPGVLSTRARVLSLAPIALTGAVFLLLGATLLFLRAFPWLLRRSAAMATRGKSAAPVLALAQMARNPRQSLRTIMLLAIATGFTIFALLFNASQAQRVVDVASFQVGADFSGPIFGSATIADSSIYARLPGVLAASVGYKSSVQAAGHSGSIPAELRAVDANTYAQTAAWSPQDSSQPLAKLMARLVSLRKTVPSHLIVPAIVDSSTWDVLNLSAHPTFSITDLANVATGPVIIHCIAVAEVQNIPTINDSLAYNDTGGYIPLGGILVDFQSYETAVRTTNYNQYIPTTEVWVRTSANPSTIAETRQQLVRGPWHLDVPLNDRWAIINSLNNDPLFLALRGLLIIGAVTALLLAMLSNLIASWQHIRGRLTSFVVLRALGSDRQHIAGVLIWEQSIVYLTSIVLGVLFGVLLSILALPALIFSSVGGVGQVDTSQFYVIQSVPSVAVVIPVVLYFTLGILAVVCIVALIMLVRIVSRPSISQTLRLNED